MLAVHRQLPGDLHKLRPFQSVAGAFLPDCECDIKRAVLQSGEYFLGGKVEQLQPRIRMLLGKVRHCARQETAGERGRVADAQPHAPSGGPHALHHLVGPVKKLARFTQQRLAHRSQADGMCLTFEQALAYLILERFDLSAQCRLRQKHFLRRAADIGSFGDGHEVAQLTQFHSGSISKMQSQAKNSALAAFVRDGHYVRMKTTETTLTPRRANERGHADHGWLNSYHTFSFADYYDPAHIGFRSLRVINDDRVAPGQGFGTHPHRDMEIFSYVLQGALQHKDSMGNGSVLKPGQIQLMSAGRGVTHSEFNPSRTEPLHFLQIWIQPSERGLAPSHTEWRPTPTQANAPKVLVFSPDGRENSAIIHQDAEVYRIRLQPGQTVTHELKPGRGRWLQIAEGAVACNGVALETGDGASSEEAGTLSLIASRPTEALLFDLS